MVSISHQETSEEERVQLSVVLRHLFPETRPMHSSQTWKSPEMSRLSRSLDVQEGLRRLLLAQRRLKSLFRLPHQCQPEEQLPRSTLRLARRFAGLVVLQRVNVLVESQRRYHNQHNENYPCRRTSQDSNPPSVLCQAMLSSIEHETWTSLVNSSPCNWVDLQCQWSMRTHR